MQHGEILHKPDTKGEANRGANRGKTKQKLNLDGSLYWGVLI